MKVHLFGFDFLSADDYSPIMAHFEQNRMLSKGELPIMITPNVDTIIKYNSPSMSDVQDFFSKSSIIIPDGQPLVWVSKLKHGKNGLKKRLTGSDFFPLFWKWAKQSHKKVFFVIPNNEVGKLLKDEAPETTDFLAPPFFDVKDEKEFSEVMHSIEDKLKEHQPDFVMIGLNFPKQEIMTRHLLENFYKDSNLPTPFFFLIGASFEFYLNRKKRAPAWMQRNGMEFLHRLLSEPRRLAKRYFIDDIAFLPMAIKELFKK